MLFPNEAIEEFSTLYQKHYGIQLTNEQATDALTTLLDIIELTNPKNFQDTPPEN
jgi:hypothetical protein